MSEKLTKFGGIILLLAISTIYLSTYIVDKTQYAIEILLGDPVDIVLEPGLNFKFPFVSRIVFMENRLQDYDADPGAVFTKDKKEMKVDTYSKWRVSDPLKFYETVRTTNGAHARLDDIIYSQTREILGAHTLMEIVSGNRKEIRESITLRSRKNAMKFGIEILDVRIKRADLPEQNSQSVFGRMNAERRRQAKLYRSEGEEESLKIRSDADRERVEIIAEAKKINEETRGGADAKATKIYADAYQKDMDFFKFLRSHDVYRNSLQEGTTLLMDANSKFFKYLKD
ncbi:MAG: protease modulator HflC [Deltaproteobacteria bacterium]|jgi:membrane protease subunit HflC|nr:protease modulator HflC [Deltaproteobacteria bacterium]MBT7810545.1 protease modulator HflC [Deltaproteobacteria bacterium]|tara:strand:- start:1485 stop:2339 length:855 start_codon:yes stop_codon:yes gene_type:complete